MTEIAFPRRWGIGKYLYLTIPRVRGLSGDLSSAEALKNAERKGCNLSGEGKLALAKGTLLTEEDVEMWLQHLSDVSTRRKEGAKKAAATRRQKNKGHTDSCITKAICVCYDKKET